MGIALYDNVNVVQFLMPTKALIDRNTRLDGSKLMLTVKYLQ